LDPKFLTKDVLAQLFNPCHVKQFEGGILLHSMLPTIWNKYAKQKNFNELAKILMALMFRFEVCFPLKSDEQRPFMEQRSLIPAMLPDYPPEQFFDYWTDEAVYQRIKVERYLQFNIIPKEMVSRLFVRLHHELEEALIWKSGMYFDQADLKALIRVFVVDNQLQVAAQASNGDQSRKYLSMLLGYVNDLVALYQGVHYTEMVCTNVNPRGLLKISEVRKEYTHPTSTSLKCPATRNVIDPEKLLVYAGVIDDDREKPLDRWWSFHSDKFQLVTGTTNPFYTYTFYDDGQVLDEQIYGKLQSLANNLPPIKKAFAVYNPLLEKAYEYFLKTLIGRFKTAGKLFKKDDYKQEKDATRKQKILDDYKTKMEVHPFNKSDEKKYTIPILPAFQGLNETVAMRVCESGYSVDLPSNTHFFGKGLYFTTDPIFALQSLEHQKVGADASPNKVLVLSILIPGNVFPVTEHPFKDENKEFFLDHPDVPKKEQRVPNPKGYYQKGIRPGYQCHYTLVEKNKEAFSDPEIFRDLSDRKQFGDQIVVFENSQALPLYVLFL